MHRNVKHALALATMLLAVPATTRAQTAYTYASAYAGTFMPNGNQQHNGDSDYVNGSSSHNAAATYTYDQPDQIDGLNIDWTQSSTSSVSVSASGGQLHLIAQAQSQVSPSSFTYYDGDTPIIVNSPLTAVAICNGNGSLRDTITITSDTLPRGTPVDLRVTTTLDCSVSSPPYGNAEADAQVLFYNQSGTYSDDNGNTYFGFVVHKSNGGLPSGDTEQTNDVLHTFVGDAFTVELDAQVSAVGDADYGRPFGAAMADAGKTAFFNLDSLTPGAGYSTGSGLSYVSPLPEPASLAMIGLAALPMMRRRRGSR